MLRMVHRRLAAVTAGGVLVACAFVVRRLHLLGDGAVEQGLVFVIGASGVAFLLAGIGGRRADWVEPS